jgi:hypothetical protein
VSAIGVKAIENRSWPTLVMMGLKAIENRSWPIRFRGRIGIHATAARPDGRCWTEFLDDFGLTIKHDLVLTVCGRKAVVPAWKDLPLGAVLGSVEVYDCLEDVDLPDEYIHDPFVGLDCWCWLLRDPRPLAVPFACKGALSLWPSPKGLRLA